MSIKSHAAIAPLFIDVSPAHVVGDAVGGIRRDGVRILVALGGPLAAAYVANRRVRIDLTSADPADPRWVGAADA